MRDVARKVELISLPLRLAMIADRAAAALERIEGGGGLDADGESALQNVHKFIEEATHGKKIVGSTSMSGYSREAVQAYRLSERVKVLGNIAEDVGDTGEFLSNLSGRVRRIQDEKPVDLAVVNPLRDFFDKLARVSLSLDTGVLEHVQRRADTRIQA